MGDEGGVMLTKGGLTFNPIYNEFNQKDEEFADSLKAKKRKLLTFLTNKKKKIWRNLRKTWRRRIGEQRYTFF